MRAYACCNSRVNTARIFGNARAAAHRPRAITVLRASLALLAGLLMALGCNNKRPADPNDTRSTLIDPNSEPTPRWEGADPDAAGQAATQANTSSNHARAVQRQGRSLTPTATLPGFRMLSNGRSRVFLEVSGDVPMTEAHAPGKLRYRFAGVRVPERVNRMPLLTLHFPTPVARVQLNQVGADAVLVIELRGAVNPEVRVERRDGAMVVSADFPRLEDMPAKAADAT